MSRRAAPFVTAVVLPLFVLCAASSSRAQPPSVSAGGAEDHALQNPAEAAAAPPAELARDVPGARGDPVEWDPAWPEFGLGEYIAVAAGGAVLLAGRVLPLPTAHWRGGFGFDESARRTLRLRTRAGRRWARDGSDIGIIINASWPFLDSLVAAGWYRDSPRVAVQQSLITVEVMAVTAGIQGLVSYFSSRERPYGRECGGELEPLTRDCVNRDRYYSFFSGHSSQSFAAAAVNCMHHSYVPLYGGAADRWACVGTFGVAATTALLRVATDVHYVSDVAVGALVGTATGLLLPWALHYRHGGERNGSAGEAAPSDSDAPSVVVLPSIGPGYGGLYGMVTF